MLTLPEWYTQEHIKPIADGIRYSLDIEYGIIDTKAMRDKNIGLDIDHFEYKKGSLPDDGRADYSPAYLKDYLKKTVTYAKDPVQKPFATFEQNYFKLDWDGLRLYDKTNPDALDGYYQGFVSKEVCGDDARFIDNQRPSVTYTFDELIFPYGLTLLFDSAGNTFPEEFTVTATTKDDRKTEINHNAAGPESEVVFPTEDSKKGFKEIKIVFNRMNRPNLRARLAKVVFGVYRNFGNDVLTDTFTCEFDLDAASSRMPRQKMSFSLYDADGDYNMENPKSFYEYLTEKQPIKAALTAKHDEQEEIFPICAMVLSGKAENKGKSVSFSAESYLQNTKEKAVNLPSGGGMIIDLLKEVFKQMDMPVTELGEQRWKIEEGLESLYVITTANLNGEELNKCVQMLCQAGNCIVYEDFFGIIHVKSRPPVLEKDESFDEMERKYIHFNKMFSVPELNKYPPLEKVSLEHGASGTVSSDIYGVGEIQEIKNPVIKNISNANTVKNIANHLGKEYSLRNEFSTSIRSGIELEPFDQIIAQTQYAKKRRALITKKTLKFNGALNSDIRFIDENKIIEDDNPETPPKGDDT